MNTNNNFEVKYTVRLYDDVVITELRNQFEKVKETYRNKNEFLARIIDLGLAANRKSLKPNAKNKPSAEAEESEMYQLLLEIFKYTSTQFKKIYIDHNVLQRLLCAMYSILTALNNDERLYDKKLEDGFYDDLPPRFSEIIDDLKNRYGIS